VTGIIHLPDGKVASVQSHNEKIWLHLYNGCGVTVALDKKQAMQLRRMLFDAVYQEEG
jgi:hypothetical protein